MALRRNILVFLVGLSLGFVLAYNRTQKEVIIHPVKRAQHDPWEKHAALLKCPVSRKGIQEWDRVCRAQRRSSRIGGAR